MLQAGGDHPISGLPGEAARHRVYRVRRARGEDDFLFLPSNERGNFPPGHAIFFPGDL